MMRTSLQTIKKIVQEKRFNIHGAEILLAGHWVYGQMFILPKEKEDVIMDMSNHGLLFQ